MTCTCFFDNLFHSEVILDVGLTYLDLIICEGGFSRVLREFIPGRPDPVFSSRKRKKNVSLVH